VASVTTLDPDPNHVIPSVIRGTRDILDVAAAEPSIKRFVLTSSSLSAYPPIPDTQGTIKLTDWNELAVEQSWAPPPYEPSRAFAVYSASKTMSEKEMWSWSRDVGVTSRPDLVLNAVLPSVNIGPVLLTEKQGLPSTVGFFKSAWDGRVEDLMAGLGSQYFVDVRDVARLHVAALLMKDVESERVFAFAQVYHSGNVLEVLRQVRPERKFQETPESYPKHLYKVPNEHAEEMLKKLGRKGWTSMHDSISEMVKAYEYADAQRAKA
jgi:nucleoside-diphosphate-sugar epimerase